MALYLKHGIANFFYAVDIENQQVETCCTVSGKERIERYEGVSGALQTGNVLISEQEYNNAKDFALRQLGFAVNEKRTSPTDFLTNLLSPPLN